MPVKSKLILTAPPEQAAAARESGLTVAHMAYRIGGGPHLFRARMPVAVRGGPMVIGDQGFDGSGGEAAPFCQEVLRECAARGFTGVTWDFERRPIPLRAAAVQNLGELLSRRGWPLYVTEPYGLYSDKAGVLISSALSGGSLRQRLEDARETFGGRVVLAVERVAEDFFLPSPTGQGVPLTREDLRARLEERSPSVFFSSELCAHYFTYMSRENGAHFILFDDAGSIRKKLQLARGLGIETAVLAYPQVDDLLPQLLEE